MDYKLCSVRWTEPIRNFKTTDKYALGYNSKGNHKMLKFFYCQQAVFEIHDFSSYSWRVLSITRDWSIPHHQLGVFLKGNAYFVVKDVRIRYSEVAWFLICFDFTRERFGQLLPLSFHSYTYGYPVTMTMSCGRAFRGSTNTYKTVYIIGEECFKSVRLGESRKDWRRKLVCGFGVGMFYPPHVFSSYLPSLVQVNQPHKKNERDT
ncbi:LOW QUALITY PROTEIN: hypothetical protein BRARA_E01961 [Brassica rapa]|uniref:F-box associated beta-propeller type 1 domain-containing protein n=1 Tax=Brassica campestris TaxID=3711 RepID=A0A397ZBT5_BRACM|nr:LOW QUALITY PROTEIN: hypothetical protein BRARA_E01961 [Brassica rapa]